MRPLRRSLAFLLVLVPASLAAQSPDSENADAFVIGERHTLRSEVLGEDRVLWVYTPAAYETSSGVYPVVYLLDGSGHFHHTTGAVDFLSRQQRMPEAIVVGVTNTDRTRDMSPTPLEGRPDSGGADAFLDFLTTELRPWVEARYRAAPHDVLIGHSLGGLLAVHALVRDPDTFDAYLAISPSLWWDDEVVVRAAEAALFTDEDRPATGSLYMTMGNEGGRMLAGAWGLARVLETRAPDGFDWTFREMPAETHGSVPARSTYDGLEWLFREWALEDFVAVVANGGDEGLALATEHYERLSEKVGYTVRPPEMRVNGLGYALLGNERVEDAVRVFEWNTRMHPDSPNVYDSLGDAYRAACRSSEAVAMYERAVRMAGDVGHPNEEAYRSKLEEARETGPSETDCTD